VKATISLLLTFGICGVSYGQDIELLAPRIVCIDTQKNGESTFKIAAAILNSSNKPVTVVTGGFSKGILFSASPEFQFHLGKTTVSGSLIVPSVSDLSLVELNSGESAFVNFTTSAQINSNTASLSYNVDDTHSERYGYWSGYLKTNTFDITEGRGCTL